MHKNSSAAIALLGCVVLSMAVSSASAGHLEVSNSANGFKIAWNPLTLEAAGLEVRCPVTLEGTFERSSIAKRTTENIGRVTGAAVGTCTRSRATLLRETLPWTLHYSSFAGTLPNITSVSVDLIRMSFQVNLEGIECLAATRAEQPWGGIATIGAGSAITGFRADESRGIETSGGIFCTIGGRAFFNNAAATITNRAGTGAITIRLI